MSKLAKKVVKIKTLKVVLLVIGISFFAMAFSNNASAASLSLSCKSEFVKTLGNDSIKYACDHSGTRGAMWLSAGVDARKDVVKATSDGDGKITAYLYGSVHGAYKTGSLWANNIHILNSETKGYRTSFSNEVSWLSFSTHTLNRGTGRNTSYPSWTTGWNNHKITVKIDFNKFKKVASYDSSTGYWTKEVHIYRCYGKTYNGSSGSCYSDPSTIKIKDPTQKGVFYSQSTVSYNGTTSTGVLNGKSNYNNGKEVDIAADKSSVNLTFHHWIVIDDEDKYTKNAKTNATVSGDSIQIALNDSGWKKGTDGAEGKRMIKVEDYEKSVSLDKGQTKTVCQKVTYTPKKFTIQNGVITYSNGTKGSSQACITLHRLSDDEVVEQETISCKHTINYGNSFAFSGVKNFNRESSYITTSYTPDASTATTYAKPGDEVRFKHVYCYGAQAVTTSYSFGASRVTPSESEVPSNWFKVTSSPTSAYLFDRSSNSKLQNGITLTKAQSEPASVTSAVPGVQYPSDYKLRIYSPIGTANNAYKCQSYWNFLNTGKGYTYQIPGFADDAVAAKNCKATSISQTAANTDSRMKNSDVGRTISQSLDWRYVEAWVSVRSYTTGSCGCANSSLQGHNFSVSREEAHNNESGGNGEVEAYCRSTSRCNCGKYGCVSTYYSSSVRYKYPVASYVIQPSANTRKTAEVKIPYNFMTETESSLGNDDEGIVYAGETTTPSFSVSILERMNQLVDKENAYKTITPKDTKIEMVAYTVSDKIDTDDNVKSILSGTTSWSNNNSVCDYFRTKLGAQCLPIDASEGALNPEGELQDTKTYKYEKTITVPDVEEGFKLCVAIGVSHADSHGLPDTANLSNSDGANATSMSNANPNWRISGSSCRTIAKKPTVQIWGDTYSNGGISTTTSHKAVGAGLASSVVKTDNYVFGSWDEYLTLGNGTIRGFASGAALGYNGMGGRTETKNYCDLTHITIANTNCSKASNASSGDAGVESVNSNIAGIISQIRARYTTKTESGRRVTLSGGTGADYIYYDGDTTLDSSISNGLSNTLVIEVDGDITINSNICYGSGTCGSSPSSLYLSQRNLQSYSNLSSIPQIIIIADSGHDINIGPDVTQIDAWLIADSRNHDTAVNGATIGSDGEEIVYGSGTIDTCSLDGGVELSSTICNKTIIFNGPVFADSILLNRTGGAFSGKNSYGFASINKDLASADRTYNSSTGLAINSGYGAVTPAEIFNLRADVYFWSYAQANRLTQATTTYMRELAPRY